MPLGHFATPPLASFLGRFIYFRADATMITRDIFSIAPVQGRRLSSACVNFAHAPACRARKMAISVDDDAMPARLTTYLLASASLIDLDAIASSFSGSGDDAFADD